MPATHHPRVPAWPPRSAPRLFVDGHLAVGERITLDGPQAHYLVRVMRAGEGTLLSSGWKASLAPALAAFMRVR